MRRDDKLVALGVLLTVVVFFSAVGYLQQYLGEDYRRTRDCPGSYWTCESVSSGVLVLGVDSNTMAFDGSAMSCNHNGAYEKAARRARFNCSASGLVHRGSCETVETACELPESRLYDL